MPSKRPTRAHDNEPETTNREDALPQLPALPWLERIQQELASATDLNDFFGKTGSSPACLPSRSSRCSKLI